MIIWVAIPSYQLDRGEEATQRWAARGFRTLLVINKECVPANRRKNIRADVAVLVNAYEGYYRTLNHACLGAFTEGRADVVVCAGDRLLPPEYDAHKLAAAFAVKYPNGMGVMQPTAHVKATAEDGSAVDRLWLESPWVGKPFWRAVYGGHGPYYPRYFQYFGNRELGHVAQKMGVLWLNPAAGTPKRKDIPDDFIARHNKAEYWTKDENLWNERLALGFPDTDHWDPTLESVAPKIWTP